MIDAVELGLIERRITAAVRLVGDERARAERIAKAPHGYLVALDSGDVARHAGLLSPVPGPSEIRVAVTPGPTPSQWHVDVAARDRPGLLAASTGVLALSGIDVIQAVVATWDDGAALQAFVVGSALTPDPAGLQMAFAASLDRPLWAPAMADATLTFDAGASTVYTACQVQAADRPGLLHTLAVAIAAAGADIHAARVTTADGVACDHFDLSDRSGAKLDGRLEAAIRDHVHTGVAVGLPKQTGRRSVFSRRRLLL